MPPKSKSKGKKGGSKGGSSAATTTKPAFVPAVLDEKAKRFTPEKYDYTPEQQNMCKELRKLAKAPKSYSDNDVYRFLRARDYKLDDAVEMLSDEIEWKSTYVKLTSDSVLELDEYKWGGAVLLPNLDAFGRAILFLRPRVHNPNTRVIDNCLQVFIDALDRAIEMMKKDHRGAEKLIILWDLNGWGLKNRDNALLQMYIDTLQSYYPERMAHCVICNYPWVVWAVWKVAQLWLDANTKKKVEFCDVSVSQQLMQFIDKEHLPESYRGNWKEPAIELESFPAKSGGWFSGWFGGATKVEQEHDKLTEEEKQAALDKLSEELVAEAKKDEELVEKVDTTGMVAKKKKRNRNKKKGNSTTTEQ